MSFGLLELARVQIARVEISDVPDRIPINETHDAPVPLDQPVALERLEHPVDMDSGEPGCIGKLLLGHRQLVNTPSAEGMRIHSECELAQKVGDPAAGVAASDVEHPLTEYGCFDERRNEHCSAEARIFEDQLLERRPRNFG